MGLNRIFQILVPKEKKFFPLFKAQTDALSHAAGYLVAFANESDTGKQNEIYRRVKEQEKTGDKHVYQIYQELNGSFITPFDREDIQQLASRLDDVLDSIHDAVRQAVIYMPHSTPEHFIRMAKLIQTIVEEIKKAIYELENIKKKPEMIEQVTVRVFQLEEDADDLFADFLRDLFRNEKDAIELIKLKDIMHSLETAADKAEDVTDTLRTILVKLA